MIMISPVTEDNSFDWEFADTSRLVYIGMGSEDFKGHMLPYEEYLSDLTTTRYFFDGKDVVGIRSITPGEAPTDMEILEMSDNIPSRLFEISKDYQVISDETAT